MCSVLDALQSGYQPQSIPSKATKQYATQSVASLQVAWFLLAEGLAHHLRSAGSGVLDIPATREALRLDGLALQG
jgi:hypothetical protein